MKNEKLGIGIIGCGNISGIHAEAIKNTDSGRLVSAYSRNEKNLGKITGEFDINGFTDIEKFLADESLDAVSICTPSGTHLDYAELAAEAGKHVIIEKPIEVSVERARHIIDICRTNNVRLAVIYQNRFIEDVMKMKKIINNGTIGEIFMADAYIKWFRSREYYESGAWRGTLKLDGGGVLINQAIHTVDLLIWLAGDVKSLYANTGTFTHSNIEGEDNAAVSLKFKNGAIGTLEASTSVIPAFKRKIEIHGEKGTAVLEGDNFSLLKVENDLKKERKEEPNAGGSSPLAGFSIEPHKKQFNQIINAILYDTDTVVSGEESLKSLSLVKAVYQSAREDKPVDMDSFTNE